MRALCFRALAVAAVWVGLAPLGCGYRSLNEMRDPLGPYEVRLGELRTASPEVSVDVLGGARSALARAGMLGAKGCGTDDVSSCPVLFIDVVRIDESGASPGWDASKQTIVSRGIWIRAVGRARLYSDVGKSALLRDTQDVAASVLISPQSPSPHASVWHREQALSAAARKLGERLALKIMGMPDPEPDELAFAPDALRASVSAP